MNGIRVKIVTARQPDGRWKFRPDGYPCFFVNARDNWSCRSFASKRSAAVAGEREYENFLVRS